LSSVRKVKADDIDEFLAPLREVADPLERFCRAGAQAALYREVADELYRLRALAALEMAEAGASLSTIANLTGLSRARAQSLVEDGRTLRRR
jgi:protein tyrosine phosphatase (PTP) superfamily phosphohydrolase (DUF442 family)